MRPNCCRQRATFLANCLAIFAVAAVSRGDCAEIAVCGFEPEGDTWSFAAAGGGVFNATSGAGDFPPNQRILSGSQSWAVTAATSVLVFSEMRLAGWTDVAVAYRVSSTSVSGAGGASGSDSVAAYLAVDGNAFGDTADILLKGNSRARWGYDSGAPPTVATAGAQGIVVQPASGGLRTTDGYSDFKIRVAADHSSLAFKIYAQNDLAGTSWNIDDVVLQGTPTVSNSRWWAGDGSGPVGGVDAVWDNTAAKRWASASDGAGSVGWNEVNGDNAFFARSNQVVTIASETTVAARSLTFSAGGCTIAGGDSQSKLVLSNGGSGGAGANTIEVANSSHTATINATIIGNPGVGLTKTGAGTLVLGGVNLYTGPTAILGGGVSVAATYNLGATGAKVCFDGGILRFTAPVNLRGDHPFVFQPGGGVVDTQGFACAALADRWSGTGTFTKTGGGVLALDGAAPAFSGTVNVRNGTLRLGSNDVLGGASAITVGAGATLDVSAVADYRLGITGNQKLQGTGTIIGNLRIGPLATHQIGSSPGVQTLQGNYTMDGALQIEISGASPGDGVTGYDQVVVGGGRASDVSLSGSLMLAWSGTGWSAPGDKLWIIRNDTAGALQGTFRGYANGAPVGSYDGVPWLLYYGADAASGGLSGGNDVVLFAGTQVPEPGSTTLVIVAGAAAAIMRLLGRRRARRPPSGAGAADTAATGN